MPPSQSAPFRNTIFDSGDCVVCAGGHLPTGQHQCVECGVSVHTIDGGCSVAVDDQEDVRICLNCSKKPSKETNTIDESLAVENWHGQAIIPTATAKRSSASYLSAQPELGVFDEAAPRGKVKLGVLKKTECIQHA